MMNNRSKVARSMFAGAAATIGLAAVAAPLDDPISNTPAPVAADLVDAAGRCDLVSLQVVGDTAETGMRAMVHVTTNPDGSESKEFIGMAEQEVWLNLRTDPIGTIDAAGNDHVEGNYGIIVARAVGVDGEVEYAVAEAWELQFILADSSDYDVVEMRPLSVHAALNDALAEAVRVHADYASGIAPDVCLATPCWVQLASCASKVAGCIAGSVSCATNCAGPGDPCRPGQSWNTRQCLQCIGANCSGVTDCIDVVACYFSLCDDGCLPAKYCP